jgi:hypothetical protein
MVSVITAEKRIIEYSETREFSPHRFSRFEASEACSFPSLPLARVGGIKRCGIAASPSLTRQSCAGVP